MDNLVSACENGVALTRTSSDPNLNKHCQEGRVALDTVGTPMGSPTDDSLEEHTPDTGLGSEDPDVETCEETPPQTPPATADSNGTPLGESKEEEEHQCFTTQPLPCLPHPLSLGRDCPVPMPVVHQALPRSASPPLPPPLPPPDEQPWTVDAPHSPAAADARLSPPELNGFAHADEREPDEPPPPEGCTAEAAELLAIKRPPRSTLLEDSTETLTEQSAIPPQQPPLRRASAGEAQASAQVPTQPQCLKEEGRRTEGPCKGDLVPVRERGVPKCALAARRLVSQSQLSDFTLLGSPWGSVQGLVQSACGGALQQGGYQSRRLASKLLRAQGAAGGSSSTAAANGHCCRRDRERDRDASARSSGPNGTGSSSWLSAVKSSSYAALCASTSSSGPYMRQLLAAAQSSSPSASASPPPPLSLAAPPVQAPAYLDDDGLPVALDAVQQRLRQIEATYKQEVEVLRRQVRQLQMRLESKQYCTPPSEPDMDYEDDIVSVSLCLPVCLSSVKLCGIGLFTLYLICMMH